MKIPRPVNPDPVIASGLGGPWWLVGAAVGITLGAVAYLVTPQYFEATVAVRVSETPAALDLAVGGRGRPVTPDTDAQLLRSDAIESRVAEVTADPIDAVPDRLHVSARPLTRVLEITYTSSTPIRAAKGARAAATTFLAVRQQLVLVPIREYLIEVEERTRLLDSEQLGGVLDSGDAAFRVETWRGRAIEALMQPLSAGELLEEPLVPDRGHRGDPEVPMASGTATGALAGIFFAMFRNRRLRQRGRGAR